MLAQRNEYKIASTQKDHIVITNPSTHCKFLYREYPTTPSSPLTLAFQSLMPLTNPHLLRVTQLLSSDTHLGVYCQHYCMTLQSQLARVICEPDPDSLINTLTPVKLAIEYLHEQDVISTEIGLRNIVVDEQGDVKLAHDLIIKGEVGEKRRDKEGSYGGLLEVAMMLLGQNTKEKHMKAKLKELRGELDREVYRFLSEIYQRTRPKIIKIKKIRKKQSGLFNNENTERSNPRNKGQEQRLFLKSSEESYESEEIPIKPLNQ